jgi:hypothetical protein
MIIEGSWFLSTLPGNNTIVELIKKAWNQWSQANYDSTMLFQ